MVWDMSELLLKLCSDVIPFIFRVKMESSVLCLLSLALRPVLLGKWSQWGRAGGDSQKSREQWKSHLGCFHFPSVCWKWNPKLELQSVGTVVSEAAVGPGRPRLRVIQRNLPLPSCPSNHRLLICFLFFILTEDVFH